MEAVDILICESDEHEARAIHRALRPILNRVTIVTTAKDAKDCLYRRGRWSDERRVPDLILLDADMVGTDCWELLCELTASGPFADSVFVVLSADPSMEKAERARASGAEWFVGKPVRMDTLARITDSLEDMGLAVIRARVPAAAAPAGSER